MSQYAIKGIEHPELCRAIRDTPASAAQRNEMPQMVAPAAGNPETTEPDRPLRVLLAADSVDNRFLIRAFLKGTPYRLEEAENGDVAVEKFKRRRYDLVLIDMHMPLVDDYSAVREIRKWEAKQGLPRTLVVALTASAFAEDRHQALHAGCDDYISKPVSKRSLLDTIRAWYDSVDSRALAELSECDASDEESLVRALIDQFLSDLDPRLSAMRKAVSDGDFLSMQITAHALKGSCGHFGAHRMARLCTYLECGGRDEMNANSHELVAELELEARHVRLALGVERERVGGPAPPLDEEKRTPPNEGWQGVGERRAAQARPQG